LDAQLDIITYKGYKSKPKIMICILQDIRDVTEILIMIKFIINNLLHILDRHDNSIRLIKYKILKNLDSTDI